jgi:hypothetical protein
MVRGRPSVSKIDHVGRELRVMPMMVRVMLGLRAAQHLRYRRRDHAQQDRDHPK